MPRISARLGHVVMVGLVAGSSLGCCVTVGKKSTVCSTGASCQSAPCQAAVPYQYDAPTTQGSPLEPLPPENEPEPAAPVPPLEVEDVPPPPGVTGASSPAGAAPSSNRVTGWLNSRGEQLRDYFAR